MSGALEGLGLDSDVLALASQEKQDLVLGRITRVDRGMYNVATQSDAKRATLSSALTAQPAPEERPAIGDWVLLDAEDVIEVVLQRRSAFRRGDADRLRAQVVAANIDVVFVVHAVNDEPNFRRLERELALAWESGATPVIVLTKSDDCDDAIALSQRFIAVAQDVEVVVTSAHQRRGLEDLVRFARPNRTVTFIGASGVGKSSLVNALLDEAVQEVKPVRESDGRGRHTTTHRELFSLTGGGVLIDTPGLRSLGMWQSDAGIAKVFADIQSLAQGCRFSDCAHEIEPGCAVMAAASVGEIDPARIANYKAMLAELDSLDRESEVRSRLDKQRRSKLFSRAAETQRQPTLP